MSPNRAWRPAGVARLTRTLGRTTRPPSLCRAIQDCCRLSHGPYFRHYSLPYSYSCTTAIRPRSRVKPWAGRWQSSTGLTWSGPGVRIAAFKWPLQPFPLRVPPLREELRLYLGLPKSWSAHSCLSAESSTSLTVGATCGHIPNSRTPRPQCGLTTRSSGAPTAGHQARSGGTRYIFASPGLASCRCRPLSSNVRPRLAAMRIRLKTARARAHRLDNGRALRRQSHCGGIEAAGQGEQEFAHGSSASAERDLLAVWPRRSSRAVELESLNRKAMPNQSFKRRATGVALGPQAAVVHHAACGPSATPLSPA